MSSPFPILTPAGFVSPQAMAWANADGLAQTVSASAPLPVTLEGGTLSVALAPNAALESGGNLAAIRSALGGTLSVAGALGRSWALSAGADSVTATIAGTPNVAIAGTPSVSISGNPVLGAGSAVIGAVSNAAFGATQQGTWAVGRTWGLSSGTDSVTATIAGTANVAISGNPVLGAGSAVIGAVNLDIGGSAVSAANPVPVANAWGAPVVTAWGTATAVNAAASVMTAGYDTVIVTLAAGAGLAGGQVVFEAFDGVNWIGIKAPTITDYTTTGAVVTPVAGSSKGYQVPVAGFPQFRVRLASAVTAGTLTVTTIVSSAPDVSLVTVGLDPAQPLPAGGNTLGAVMMQDGYGNPINASLPTQVLNPVSNVATASATATGVILNMTVAQYNSFVVEMAASTGGSHSLIVEGNNTGLATDYWYSLSGWPTDDANAGATSTRTVASNSSSPYVYAKRFDYIRVRCSAYGGSGTISVRVTAGMAPVTRMTNTIFVTPGTAAGGSYSMTGANAYPVGFGSKAVNDVTTAYALTVPTVASGGQQVVLPYSVPEASWQYAAASGGDVKSGTATATLKAAPGAALRAYVARLTVSHDALAAAVELVVQDSASVVLYRGKLQAAAGEAINLHFDPPLRPSANAAISVTTSAALTSGAVYVNAQGYVAA